MSGRGDEHEEHRPERHVDRVTFDEERNGGEQNTRKQIRHDGGKGGRRGIRSAGTHAELRDQEEKLAGRTVGSVQR